jgi:AraC-like DNA-binding protein
MSGRPPPDGPADFEFLCGAYRLPGGQAHEYLAALPDFVMGSPEDGDGELASLTGLLVADLAEARPATEVTRSALLDLLLTHVLRRWLRDDHHEVWPHVGDPVVTAALRRVHQDPRRPWTVSELSTAAGVSRTAFTRRFTRLMGKPPRDYLSGVRLAQGARLLRETTLPLAAVARQVGYSSEFAFGGAFRRVYGISPGRFRATTDGGPAN